MVFFIPKRRVKFSYLIKFSPVFIFILSFGQPKTNSFYIVFEPTCIPKGPKSDQIWHPKSAKALTVGSSGRSWNTTRRARGSQAMRRASLCTASESDPPTTTTPWGVEAQAA